MTKVVADAAAGSLPDMIYAQGSQIQFYISKKTVLPISSYLSKDKAFDIADFPKVAIDMYSRSGQVLRFRTITAHRCSGTTQNCLRSTV